MPAVITQVVGTPINAHLAEVLENGNGRLRYYVVHPNHRHPDTNEWTRNAPEIKAADAGDECRFKCSTGSMLFGFDNDSLGLKRRADGVQFTMRPLFLTAFDSPVKAQIVAGKIEDAQPATTLRTVDTQAFCGCEWEGWFTKARIRAQIDGGGELHVKHRLDKSLAALGKRYVGTVWQANDPSALAELQGDGEHGCTLLPLTVNGKYYIVEYLDVGEFAVRDADGNPTGQTQDVEHDYTTIAANLAANLDLLGGATYYLTVACAMGAFNVTSTTAGAGAHVTIKTNGTGGFRVTGAGTWDTSWCDFTSMNDNSLGETIPGSNGVPAAGDQTAGYLIQTGTTASSVTMANWTMQYCTPATQTPAIGWSASSTSSWVLTNARISYVTIGAGTGSQTSIVGHGASTTRYAGDQTFTNIYIDDTCSILQSTGSTAIRCITSGTNTVTVKDCTVLYTGTALVAVLAYAASGTQTTSITNTVVDAGSATGTHSLLQLQTATGSVQNATISQCFLRNAVGHGLYANEIAGTLSATIINSALIGCSGVGAYGLTKNAGATITHTHNDYHGNTNDCFEALDGTEITTDPALANLPAGCAIDTSLCNRPDGYAVTGFEMNGSDTFDNLAIDEAVWTPTGWNYAGTKAATMGPMYALSAWPETITSLTPDSGSSAGGTAVAWAGAGFGTVQGTGKVYLDGVEQTVTAWAEDGPDITTVAHAAGVVDASCTNYRGCTFTLAAAFTFVASGVTYPTHRVWGLKVKLDQRLTQDTAIGLYTPPVSGNSELRFVENEIADLESEIGEAWKSGLLGPKDFDPIVESADLMRGGGLAHVGSTKVRISNVNKLHVAYGTAGVKLHGRPAEIWEFEVNAETGAVTPYVMRYGVCSEPSWTETDYEISVENADHKRNAPMGVVVDEQGFPNADDAARGHMVPMTYGELRPTAEGSADLFAKLLRTTSYEEEFNTGDDADTDLGYDGLGQHIMIWNLDKNNREFPIVALVGAEPSLTWRIYLNSGGAPLFVDGLPAMADVDLDFYFAGKFIEITLGAGGSEALVGQRRRIEHATYKWDLVLIEFTFADHWNGFPRGNSTATHADQVWFRILTGSGEYQADTWPCAGFIDSLGAPIVGGALELYAFVQNQQSSSQSGTDYSRYWRLPGHALTVSLDGNANRLVVDLKQTEGSLDSLVAFLILPVQSIFLFPDTAPWKRFLGDSASWIKLGDGFYRYGGAMILTSMSLATETSGRDRVRTSYAEAHATFRFGGPGVSYFVILFAIPPELPANMTFDAAYIGASVEQYVTEHDHLSAANNCQMLFEWHRFIGVAQQGFTNYEVFQKDPGSSGSPAVVDTMPDFYYLSDPGLHNEYFYVPVGLSGASRRVSGYVAIPLTGIATAEQYHAVRFLSLRSRVYYSTPGAWYDCEHVIKVREWSVILKKTVNIGEAIYSPFRGRIYNDTWGGRRTAANMIQDPVDVLEHVLRCQNWSEAGATEPAAGWGKAYCSQAKIDTGSTSGGFGSAGLDTVRTLRCARQVLDYNDSYTKAMAEGLCQDFFLLQYKKHYATVASGDAGKECVTHLLAPVAAEAVLTLADVDGEIEPLVEPQAQDIFCEPLVRFCWNPGRGKFDRVIQITHSSVGTWQASYTPGFTGAEGEYFYDLCHALWDQYGQINTAPSEMTDKYWITDYGTAKQYLEWWIRWQQLRRVSFQVSYVTGRTWHVGTRVTINLPHHTNGVALNAFVERVEKSKHEGYVRCTFILLDNVITEALYLQDTWETVPADWQDTWDEGAAASIKQKSM